MEAALLGPSGRTVLSSAVVSIGRTADNQFVVNDSKVSSHHAEIRLVGQGYSITDLGSSNGTFVNEQRLASNVPRPLNEGDMIRIGDTQLRYAVVAQAPPSGYFPPGQGNNSGYMPTVAAAPAEYTGYGADAQQPYTPQQQYAPPQQQYTPPPPQQPYTPLPPVYQPPPPMPQAYIPPGPVSGANYGIPNTPQAYAQQSYAPPGAPQGVPTYGGVPGQQFYTSPPQPVQRKPGGGMRLLLIVLAIILVLVAGGGIAAYLLTRPQPTISLISDFHVGSTLAGATGTVLHVNGQKFSGNSAISFLLDGTPAPGSVNAQSDANGMLKTDLTITDGWTVGSHMLTAKDAGGYATKAGVAVQIVPPGQAHTPGPKGAPPDDMSFTVKVTIQSQDAVTGSQSTPFTDTLIVTGRPDPAGGTVCQSIDNGQPQTSTSDVGNGVTVHGTLTFSCSGTYQGGKLSYTETATSEKLDLSNGVSCVTHTPAADHLDGTFSAPNSISGTYSQDSYMIDCNQGVGTRQINAQKGTWTGQL